jgi:tetratricopeptide (TPR) repeat protein
MARIHTRFLAALFASVAAVLPAQVENKADIETLREEAQAALNESDWAAAAKKFAAITKLDPKDARSWLLLGFALHSKGDLDAALEAHMKAAEFPRVAPTATYNVACVYALKKDKEKALGWLEKAVGVGFNNASHIEADSDMDFLRDDPRFKKLLTKMTENPVAPKLQAWAVTTDRKVTRLMYWDGSKSPGQLSISYGAPEWKDQYEKAIADSKYIDRRWRLGKDTWTSLDTTLPVTIGDAKLEPGLYYMTLERDSDGEFKLTFLDPVVVRAAQIDPYLAEKTSGGITTKLSQAKSEKVAERLVISLQADDDKLTSGTLKIRFGPHELEAPVEVGLKAKQ